MRNYLLVLMLLLPASLTSAQEWAPIGAKWTYGVHVVWGPQTYYCEWQSVADTLVAGKSCRLIKPVHGPCGSEDFTDQLITYEDSNIVYLYNDYSGQFTVFYDFNKNAGESWTMKADSCELIITVDSTAMDTINGFPLKVQYIHAQNAWFPGKVVQYIGNTSQPMPDINTSCFGFVVDGIHYGNLRCYEDTVIGFHQFDTSIPTCDYTSIAERDAAPQLSIAPNPFSTTFTISLPDDARDTELSLYDISGRRMQVQLLRSEGRLTVVADRLSSGLYFAELRSKGEVMGRAKVVKE